LEKDNEIHVILLQSNGKNFCVGRDISEATGSIWERRRNAQVGGFAKLANLLATIQKPIIAAVHGAATAGGCGLALSCDMVIASEDAKFGMTAINVGLFCFGPSVPLCRAVGRKKSLELLLTGDLVDANEAKLIGLVNHVVQRERLEDAAMKLAQKLAAKSPLALQMGKKSFYAMADMEYKRALDYAEDLGLILASTKDAEEGIKAFLEKRTPNWERI
jgi:enoyl-CoA hydratase/carnithine racemase